MNGVRDSHDLVTYWRWFVPVALVFAIAVLQQIDLPGVYMDAVNPDYLVVQVLNPNHEDVVAWALRGNLLLGRRVPVLITLYHGSQQYWLGLPFFWLFGTSVIGLRLTHALFGLAILAALFILLRRARLRGWQAALTCGALAIDPTFTYAFRTQSYITLAPSMWLLFALAMVIPADGKELRRTDFLWSGIFSGFATAGYFIYAFFLPVVAAFVLCKRSALSPEQRVATRPLSRWIGGFALGASPYALGLFLAARLSGDLGGFIAFLDEQRTTLAVFDSSLSLADRVAFSWRMTQGIVENAWHHSMMFGEWVAVPGARTKVALLVALPYALWLVAELRRSADALLRALVALPLAFAAASLVFGSRLGGHHFVSLVPVLYAALAVGLGRIAWSYDLDSRRLATLLSLPLFAVAALNVAGQVAEARRLAETRGVGLLSDAINRFADDLNHAHSKPAVFTPDWGLALPIVFLTHGDVPVDSVEDFRKALRYLCAGRDVGVALIEGDRRARLERWNEALSRNPQAVTPYRQADGKVVFEWALFRADREARACVGANKVDPN